MKQSGARRAQHFVSNPEDQIISINQNEKMRGCTVHWVLVWAKRPGRTLIRRSENLILKPYFLRPVLLVLGSEKWIVKYRTKTARNFNDPPPDEHNEIVRITEI